jgi:hypothetical protein
VEENTVIHEEKKERYKSDKSITSILKDDHFYKEENSIIKERKKLGNKRKVLKHYSSSMSMLSCQLDSIKYRLKKNYFKHSQT